MTLWHVYQRAGDGAYLYVAWEKLTDVHPSVQLLPYRIRASWKNDR